MYYALYEKDKDTQFSNPTLIEAFSASGIVEADLVYRTYREYWELVTPRHIQQKRHIKLVVIDEKHEVKTNRFYLREYDEAD